MACGIYSIQSPSGNTYIGSSAQIEERWNQHKRALIRGDHFNQPLQRAWDKYKNQFEFSILLICDKDNLLLYEQQYLDFYKPNYNIRIIADSNRGIKQSPQTIAKRVAKLKGQKRSPEIGKKISEAKKANPIVFTEEHRKKLSIASKGRVQSEETKEKRRQSKLGKKFPKISEAKKGFKYSDESKLKMSLAKLGKKRGPYNKKILVG